MTLTDYIRGLRSSRDDLILYTVTHDSTLRIFMPVLDAPQHLQLHASFDLHSSLPFLQPSGSPRKLTSNMFWVDRRVLSESLDVTVRASTRVEDTKTRRAQDIKDEGWDLFLRVLSDGSLIVKALAVSIADLD